MYNDAEDFEGEFEDESGIECAFCGNDLAGERTVKRVVNGTEEIFCDDECADLFEEENVE